MTMTKLAVGEKYPTQIAIEGAYADMLNRGSNRLVVAMSDITGAELKALTKGPVKCGIAYKDGAMMMVWQFCNMKGKPVLTLDSPFQVKDITDVELPSINNDQERLLIELHVVDMPGLTIKGLRGFTLSPETTREFLSAVQDQYAHPGDGFEQLQTWLSDIRNPLASSITMHLCGQD